MRSEPIRIFAELIDGLDLLSNSNRQPHRPYPPEIEIRRRNGVCRLTAHLPDFSCEDIRISAENGELVLTCGKTSNIHKIITLPEEVDASEVCVRYLDQVLVVELPCIGSGGVRAGATGCRKRCLSLASEETISWPGAWRMG